MNPTVSDTQQLAAVRQPHLPHERIERDEQRVDASAPARVSTLNSVVLPAFV